MKNNKLILLVTSILFFLVLAALIIKEPSQIKDINRLQVTTSFYPLYFFATKIGGDKVNVSNITPSGAEPHDYEPTTSDISKIEKSRVLLLNGLGFEPWADKIKDVSKNKKIEIVELSSGLITSNDPHAWLDPVLAQEEVDKILEVFIKVDPENRSLYEKNSQELKKELGILDQEFRTSLENCSQRNIVTPHSAFGYVASRYNLKQVSIRGISPDEEPTPRDIASIVTFAKVNNIRYIFFETLLSPRLAETIAKEIGAKTLVLNPIEGLTEEEQRQGKDYFTIQRENLANLKIALDCK